MWFFLKDWRLRKQPAQTAEAGQTSTPPARQKRQASKAELHGMLKGVAALRSNDCPVKFWIPEPVEALMAELVGGLERATLSDYVRDTFLRYVYGDITVVAIKRLGDLEEDLLSTSRSQLQGKQAYAVPELGKNIAPVKVWLPAQLVADLRSLAAYHQISLSKFLREILISTLMGHATLPERQDWRGVMPTEAAEGWERGEHVPSVIAWAVDIYDTNDRLESYRLNTGVPADREMAARADEYARKRRTQK